jgi:hypothetical protein
VAHLYQLLALPLSSNISLFTEAQSATLNAVHFIMENQALRRRCGASLISSSWKVWDELALTPLDLVKALSEPWGHNTYVHHPPHPPPFPRVTLTHGSDLAPTHRPRPACSFSATTHGLLLKTCDVSLRASAGCLCPSNIAPLPTFNAQAEALDAVHFIAETHA